MPFLATTPPLAPIRGRLIVSEKCSLRLRSLAHPGTVLKTRPLNSSRDPAVFLHKSEQPLHRYILASTGFAGRQLSLNLPDPPRR